MQTSDLIISEMNEANLDSLRLIQPAGWNDIIPINRFYVESDFCHPFKVEQNGVLAGCGTAIVHGNCVWLANIIVGEQFRGNGAGTAITRHLLEYARQRSESVILIATKFGYPIYKKLGFQDDEEYVFFAPKAIPPPVNDHIRPYAGKYRAEILALDYETTGELREKLISPRLSEAYVYEDQDGFHGFTIPALGEGLTLARTTEAGVALMQRHNKRQVFFALPASNTAALSFAAQHAFEPMPEVYAIKMYLGKRLPWKPEQTYGRVGGNMG